MRIRARAMAGSNKAQVVLMMVTCYIPYVMGKQLNLHLSCVNAHIEL